MIGNIPKLGRDFGGLCRYLLSGQGGTATNPHRVMWTMTRNLMTEDPAMAARLMTATAAMSARVEKPVYHTIISWSEDEQPTREEMEQVVETTLADLGLDLHQAIVVAHGDTTNPHLHLEVNRVDPVTGVAWSTKHDYARLEKSIFTQAKEMGFKAVPGRHNGSGSRRELSRVRSRGAMMKARKQKNELQPWTREQAKAVTPKLREILQGAKSWRDVQAGVEAFGGRVERRGQGLVVRDTRGTGYIKLSALGSDIRKTELEGRFGESFATFAARSDAGRTSRKRSVFEVTEMDIALALYGMGLASREAIASAAANRQAALEQAPLHTREMRAMRQTLKSMLGKNQAPKPPPKAPDHEPEPGR